MTLLQILLVNLIFLLKINYILFLVAQLWEFLQILNHLLKQDSFHLLVN
ncbi:Uncharacterised protein [Mycobacteroides abscessus subsp. massiliense]|nr:Uncharacterised protein [Mycobacteroides abscessus subsp. massiliense]